MASRVQARLAAEQTETWLRTLADNLAEVEGDSIEAFQKRRELVELLVEKITADRDEDGRARLTVTYRFGPPPDDSCCLICARPQHPPSFSRTLGAFATKTSVSSGGLCDLSTHP